MVFMAAQQTVDRLTRVAVVDDDEDIRFYFRDLLQSTDDFRFAKDFSNANDALTSMPRLQPDLVVMDILLPDLNGIECTKRLKRTMPDLKIIIMNGTQHVNSVGRSLQAGADAYLAKPVTTDQCLATLRFVAAFREETRQNSQKSRQ